MKALIFSHKSDIDGMGSIILARLAFPVVDYCLCETFNLPNEINKYYENKEIYTYDFIFVTDMWLDDEVLTKIANDIKLQNKFYLFDHHASALENRSYNFVTIKIKDERGLLCGTSLFYDYLIQNKFLNTNQATEEFVELTRKYDTWEWHDLYNEERPHELSLLFDSLGCESYIELMTNKLKECKRFNFTKTEKLLIDNKKEEILEKIINYSQNIFYNKVLGLKAGIIFISYEYRNDLAEYLRQNNFALDFVMLIAMDYRAISYRRINPDVNVRKIAEYFGGKGHDAAASSPISEKVKTQIINCLIKDVS